VRAMSNDPSLVGAIDRLVKEWADRDLRPSDPTFNFDLQVLAREVRRLREFEWMYNDLCK
jgi:hypothetical protein